MNNQSAAPLNPEEELIDAIVGFTHDPLGYAAFAFPWGEGELRRSQGPREWQREILIDIGAHLQNPDTRYQPCQIAVASGHGIGKSALIGMVIKWALDTCEDTKVVVTANTEKQLTTKTWPEITKWCRLAITDWHKPTATAIYARDPDHEREWRADAIPWSENNTEAFAGLHNEGKRIVLVFDESSKIADKVWEVAEGALTDENTEIIWIVFGNGTRATGRFRECFRKFKHRWNNRQIDSRNVEGTNKRLFEKWAKDYGVDSDFYKVRVRGMFPSISAKQFISEEDVDAAFDRHLRPGQYENAPKILTCDPAWSGDDSLVIGLRQGLRFRILKKMPKNDNDVFVANVLARFEDDERADAVFIDAGYGTGIHSVGTTNGRDWQLVWFGGASDDPGCLNKRSAMWNATKQWLKAGGSIPPDQELRDDLIGPEVLARMDGLIALEPKEAMKSRGLQSPNCGDALALSFAFPVPFKKTAEEEERDRLLEERRGGSNESYDSTERWLRGV